jgi:SAM-dependent methyltransferase
MSKQQSRSCFENRLFTGVPVAIQITLRESVRERYAAAALQALAPSGQGSCCGGASRCGDGSNDPVSRGLYDDAESPSGGALAASLGCGNPTALIELTPGQDVLDLGSGGGLDVLLSARRVAPGTAYGLDMTDEMLQLAERNKAESGLQNAIFLRGTIESIPLPDASVDVVISNCVINLSTDKDAVLREAYRVLRPGGRLAVSDIVLLRDLAPGLSSVVGLWTGCIAGALRDSDYLARLAAAGFDNPSVQVTRSYSRDDLAAMAGTLPTGGLADGLTPEQAIAGLEGAFASAFVRADKVAR